MDCGSRFSNGFVYGFGYGLGFGYGFLFGLVLDFGFQNLLGFGLS